MNELIWHTEKRRIKDLIFFEGNPRQMSSKQAEDLIKSLQKFNVVEIPVIDQNNRIIAGNMRIQALHKLGKKNDIIEVRVANRELTEQEAREYLIRSNKNTGSWDFDLLANFDEEFLKHIGFEKEELDNVFELTEDKENYDLDKELNKILKNKTRRCKVGDIWQLGAHKLIIGNCTDFEVWKKLLNNEKFDLMFTDPPYKLQSIIKGFGVGGRKYINLKVYDDIPEYDEWLSIANQYQNSTGANVMIFESWRNIIKLWQSIEKYWRIRNIIIWHVPNRYHVKKGFYSKYDIVPLAGDGVLNEKYEKELSDYLKEKGQKLLDSYEVIIYGGINKSYWDKGKGKGKRQVQITDHISWVADSAKAAGQSIVFGTKPPQILVPYIKTLSPRDGIVMEPFGGSGSTIIASEIMHRQCRAIEISDIYAEVILDRYERFTGKEAKKK